MNKIKIEKKGLVNKFNEVINNFKTKFIILFLSNLITNHLIMKK
jgi:hypothetical protein